MSSQMSQNSSSMDSSGATTGLSAATGTHLVDKDLHDPSITVPSAVIDRSIAGKNCQDMLSAVRSLDVSFRAHVKTHKTAELTRLQVGTSSRDVRIIVSTLAEAEFLLPLLSSYKADGARVNLLYSVPMSSSAIPRLVDIAKQLGPETVVMMIDHPSQLGAVQRFKALTLSPAHVFLKVDTGYHRAGIAPSSLEMVTLLNQIHELELAGEAKLKGYYSHVGHSYGGNEPEEAMTLLRAEIQGCLDAVQHAPDGAFKDRRLVISVGASPTALSVQNIQSDRTSGTAIKSLQKAMDLDKSTFELELHAGVYPLLDMQQVATRARYFQGDPHDSIALSILTEVCSLYPDRLKPQAMIATGCLALGREPCKDYEGWGVVTPWGFENDLLNHDSRLIVAKISQEHGLVAYETDKVSDELPLQYAQRLRSGPTMLALLQLCTSVIWWLTPARTSRTK